MPPARRDRLALLALGVIALALRIPLLPAYDEDLDALRFRLAVEHFDPGALRPHAPFYPVYIALAKLAAALGASPRVALGLVSAGAGAAAIVVITLLAFEILGRRGALPAAAFALTSPFLWLTSVKLGSDVPGLALIAAPLWLLARARRLPARAPALRTTAIVLLGLGLGVRLSYFPFAIVATLLVARAEGGGRAHLARARDLAAGIVLWLVPLVIIARGRVLVTVGLAQGLGHFTRWGGSALTVSSPTARLLGALWALWANLLGGAWIDAPGARWLVAPILALLLARGAQRALPLGAAIRRQPELALGSIAYLVWAFFGQNIATKARHLLPLLPLVILALAAGAEALMVRFRAARVAAILLATEQLSDGAALVLAHRDPSPIAAVARHLDLATATDTRPILTGDAELLLREGAPRRVVIPVRDDAALIEAALRAGDGGALITSEAVSPSARSALTERGIHLTVAFARPRSRYVDPLWNELALLEARLPRQ